MSPRLQHSSIKVTTFCSRSKGKLRRSIQPLPRFCSSSEGEETRQAWESRVFYFSILTHQGATVLKWDASLNMPWNKWLCAKSQFSGVCPYPACLAQVSFETGSVLCTTPEHQTFCGSAMVLHGVRRAKPHQINGLYSLAHG